MGMKMKKIVAFGLSVIFFTGTATSCSHLTVVPGIKAVRVCIGGEPLSLDPVLNQTTDGATYISHVFEGLTKVSSNLTVVPGIAKNLPVVDSTGTTYVYKLRPDAKWSDGKPVTAQDFVYAWQRAVNPKTASPVAYQLYYIKNAESINSQLIGSDGKPEKAKVDAKGKFVKDSNGNYIADKNGKYVAAKKDGSPIWLSDLGVRAADMQTLVVTLAAPCVYFNQITASAAFFPIRQDIIEKYADKWASDPKSYLGDGPYVVSGWKHNSEITLTKNPYYYDEKEITAGKIDFELITDDTAALAAFKTGKLDIVQSAIPGGEIQNLIKSGNCKLNSLLSTSYVAVNTAQSPLNKPAVRKALSYAVDRQYISDTIMKNGEKPANAIVPYGLTDAQAGSDFRTAGKSYFDPASAAYSANMKKAKDLLASAGYPDGKNFPTLDYKYNPGSTNKSIAEYLTQAWKTNLNITVTLSSEDFNALIPDLNNGNFDLARAAYSADYADPMSFLSVFTTGNGNNIFKYHSTDFDNLIKDAEQTSDPAGRMADMHSAEDTLMSDMPAIPLTFGVDPLLVGKNVSGYKDSSLGILYLMWTKVS